ncbi:The BTB (BR-C, ttk and bab)/POZ (Pox virus and Zinc finger) domain [Ceratobasidium sp. AG-Ba]|nr:The BTB (BR-C, ttk and bab)/POZ (Pox virus and Zinc finger) domain [Ceratobasidium sp. AG-Ba]
MSVQDATRKKRVSVKTTKMLEYEADRAKSKETRNLIARTKHVRAEEAELQAQEDNSDEEVATVRLTKSKKKVTTPPPDEDEDSGNGSDHDNRGRRLELVYMIHGRYDIPVAELEPLGLAQLEDYWKNGPPKRPVQTKGKPKASNPVPKPSITKTPAKGVRASKPAVSQVTMIGSPLVVWKEAQEEAARAEYTPVPKKRTRDVLVDSEGGRRRPLDLRGKVDRAAASTRPQPSSRVVLSTSSQAGSAVPTNAPSRSKSSAPPAPPPRRETEEPEGERFDIATTQGVDKDQLVEDDVKPKKKRGSNKSSEDAKPRAKRGNYKNDQVTTMIIDRALEETLVYFRLNMCAGPDDISLMIHKGWAKAVKHCQQPVADWQLDVDLLRVVKSLVYGFRSRARQRMTRAVLSHFKLELSSEQTIDDIKERAASLIPTEFHRDPKAKHEDEGNYQSPIIARGIANIWFTGAKPTTFRFPDSMDPIPTESVAYVAALTHNILSRVAKDGVLKTETRSGGDLAEHEGVSDKKGGRANIDPVKALMAVHLKNLRTFENGDVDVYDAYLDDLRKVTLKCVGKSEEETTRSDNEPVPGMLSAASFAGEKKYIASRTQPSSNNAHDQPKPRPQPKPCPQPSTTQAATKESSKSAHVTEQSDDEDILRDSTPTAAHNKATMLGMSKPKNDELEDQAQAPRAVTPDINEDDDGNGGFQGSPETDKTSKKRKPVAGAADHEDSASEQPAEDELPVKKPHLARRPVIQDSDSDVQWEEGEQGESERCNNKEIDGKASDGLPSARSPPSATVPGTPKHSSPLSTPEPSPFVSKWETRSSKQAAKGGQVSEAETGTRMATAVEQRKAAEVEKRAQAATKKLGVAARKDEPREPQDHAIKGRAENVEDVLFKVEISRLAAHSDVFRNMLELPSGSDETEGSSDTNPVVLPQIKAEEFRNLLYLLYQSPIDPLHIAFMAGASNAKNHNSATFKRYLDVAKLAHRFCMPDIEMWAKDQLKKMEALDSVANRLGLGFLLETLSYARLTANDKSDNEFLTIIRNDLYCALEKCKESRLLEFYKNVPDDAEPALQGFLIARILSLGYKSQVWEQLPWKERAPLYALVTHLTPLPKTTPFKAFGFDAIYRAVSEAQGGLSLCVNANSAFDGLNSGLRHGLKNIGGISGLPGERRKLRAALLSKRTCQGHDCAGSVLKYIDNSLEALFVEILDLCKRISS